MNSKALIFLFFQFTYTVIKTVIIAGIISQIASSLVVAASPIAKPAVSDQSHALPSPIQHLINSPHNAIKQYIDKAPNTTVRTSRTSIPDTGMKNKHVVARNRIGHFGNLSGLTAIQNKNGNGEKSKNSESLKGIFTMCDSAIKTEKNGALESVTGLKSPSH